MSINRLDESAGSRLLGHYMIVQKITKYTSRSVQNLKVILLPILSTHSSKL